jgi:acetyl esterase
MTNAFRSVLESLPSFDLSDVPALRRVLSAARASAPLHDPRVDIEESVVPGRDGRPGVRVRIYTPVPRCSPGPALLYLHAGGFVLGGLESDEARCLRFSAEAGYVVLAVEYRLAPEHPFPAAFEDCRTVLDWLCEEADHLGIDRGRLSVGGSSAGGALAAGLSLWARDHGGPPLAAQLLVYPVIDDRLGTDSIKKFWDCPGWNGAATAQMWAHYLGSPAGAPSAYAVPARAASLAGLPRTYLLVAGDDPLRDEGLEYGARLQAAGVPTEIHEFPGVPHGFDLFVPDVPISQRAVSEQVSVLIELSAVVVEG